MFVLNASNLTSDSTGRHPLSKRYLNASSDIISVQRRLALATFIILDKADLMAYVVMFSYIFARKKNFSREKDERFSPTFSYRASITSKMSIPISIDILLLFPIQYKANFGYI